MINNRKFTNNQDTDDYVFEDELEFDEGEAEPDTDVEADEEVGEPESDKAAVENAILETEDAQIISIEEIAATQEDDSGETEAVNGVGEAAEDDAEGTVTVEDDGEAAEDEGYEDTQAEPDYEELYRDDEPNGPRRKGKFVVIAVVAVVVIAAALAAAGIIIHKFIPSGTRVDMEEYFEAYGTDGAVLIYNYEKSDYGVKFVDGNYYIDNEFLRDNYTDKFYYDEKNDTVIYTTATEIYDIPVGSTDYSIDGAKAALPYPITIKEDGILYINVRFAADRCNMVYREYDNPGRLVIVDGDSEYTEVVLSDKYVVRDKATIKGSIIEDTTDETDTAWMLTEGGDLSGSQEWIQVKSEDGRSGYVRLSHTMGTTVQYRYNSGYEEPVYPAQTKDYDILLVWHAVYDENDNDKIGDLLADSKGVNTVSPTWYKAVDADGGITSMADAGYVEYIHGLGMEIWPLISDFTSMDAEGGWDEKALLCNTDSRRKLIDNIMSEISIYGYDGINIDFEKVPQDAGDGYIQFIRELSISCREAGVVLSVDNYVPRPYNMQYKRGGQGECVDYVIVMGYDEHYAGGDEAGSVASIAFVDGGISETLKEVPAYKLINAVPFYTRLWTEKIDEDGNLTMTSKSYGMDGGVQIAEELGLETKWDDELKQNVAMGVVDGANYSIWLEDEESMGARMELIREYDIAGIAAWCLGFESDSVWDIIAGK